MNEKYLPALMLRGRTHKLIGDDGKTFLLAHIAVLVLDVETDPVYSVVR